ncbi:hypothetical protein [Nocardia fluminea]
MGIDGLAIDWAALAADLGCADQPHLSRDFRKIFGNHRPYYAQRYESSGK